MIVYLSNDLLCPAKTTYAPEHLDSKQADAAAMWRNNLQTATHESHANLSFRYILLHEKRLQAML